MALLAAVTALVAVVFGPLVSVYIGQRQINASVRSKNRQEWINTLRNTLAAFLAKQAMVRHLNALSHADEESVKRIEEVLALSHKIELLVNPRENDHSRLVELIGEISSTLGNSEETNKIDIDQCTRDIVSLSQSILKREWERVKKAA